MPKVFTSKSQRIGETGENVAVMYLLSKGYRIIERNYTKPCGEIDIVAQKGKRLYFVEVKSQTAQAQLRSRSSPEENMHHKKIMRLRRIIAQYLREIVLARVADWQCDLVVVLLDMDARKAKVRRIENIIL